MDLTSAPLEPDELSVALPTIQAYQYVMKCKALGLMLDASQFDAQTIEYIYTIYAKTHEIEQNKIKRKR